MCSTGSSAYSVLTHEEIVDLLWADEIQPLLLKRYPGLSEDQLKQAHAYAYGGAVIQDLGYYPFGSKEFSNLVHYVRSGDFVRELLLESQNLDDAYATLLAQLLERKFEGTSPALRDNILQFYSDLSVPIETKKDQPRWISVLSALDQLKSAAPAPTGAGPAE